MFTLTPTSRHRLQLKCAAREAEGYLELGMAAQAAGALRRRGALVHADAHACYLLGESLREMAQHREALIPLRRSVDLDPAPIEPWLALGWCYKRLGRLDLAIDALRSALSNQPDAAIVHYNLACYSSLAGLNLEALRRLKRAFDLDPSLRKLVPDEPDFAPMRGDIGFRMLLAAVGG